MIDATQIYKLPRPDVQDRLSGNVSALADAVERALAGVVSSTTWKSPAANPAALPLVGNTVGDVRQTLSTHDFYVWNGAAWQFVVKALTYKGTWDANANVPPLASGVGVMGDYYVVGASGNTNLDGVTDWVVADWAIFNGAAWEKADHTDAVASVFGRKGAVIAVSGDYDFPKISGTITDLQHGNRGGGALHPVVIPDPGGVAGFMVPADKTKLNGLTSGAARQTDIQFGRTVRVPAGGTLVLWGPGTTQVGARLTRAGTITGASIQVNAVDAARSYDLRIYVNGALSGVVVPLPVGTLGSQSAALALPVAAGDVISVDLFRTGGVAAQSTFTDEHATVEVTQ